MWGMPFDPRPLAVDVERHPERLHGELQDFMQQMMQQAQKGQKSGKH